MSFIRVSGYSRESVTISGLTESEAGKIQSAVGGLAWFRIVDGKLETHSAVRPLPDPVEDEAMLPFWKHHSPYQLELKEVNASFEELKDDVVYSPHITISSLCGYHYTKENYQKQAEKLESYGFIQMRSKRGNDGRYWEVWYLPGIWAARGALQEVVAKITEKAKTWEDPHGRRKEKESFDAVIRFLRVDVQFGSLDVSVQRLAMVMDD